MSRETVLVAGVFSDIAKETVDLLLGRGARVLGIGRRGLDDISEAEAPTYRHPEYRHFVADLTDYAALERVFSEIKNDGTVLTGVVNFCGSLLLKPLHLTSVEEFTQTWSTHVLSSFCVLKAVLPILSQTGGGNIVLLSSAVTRTGMPNHEAITSAKSAIEGLALSAAAGYAAKNIRINVVAPGLTATKLTKKITGSEAALKTSIGYHPLKKISDSKDVARMCAFLLHPEQTSVTAQRIAVDNGLGGLKV